MTKREIWQNPVCLLPPRVVDINKRHYTSKGVEFPGKEDSETFSNQDGKVTSQILLTFHTVVV